MARSEAVFQVARAGKGDRLTMPSVEGQNLTVSFRLPGADSSVMMRVLLPGASQNTADRKPSPPAERASTAKHMVACEPSVSVLTPVAKQLQSARCVT